MGKKRYSATEKIGVKAVETLFLELFGWITRDQTESDMGIDLHVEVCEAGVPTGRLLALQIKSGKSFWIVKHNHIVFRFDQIHYDYWVKHSLPVLIVIYNPETKEAVWQHISTQTCRRARSRWKVLIPLDQVISAAHRDALFQLARKLTLPEMVMAEEAAKESLDPRFVAKVTVTADNEHTVFYPREDVEIQLMFSKERADISEKLDRLGMGMPTVFQENELRFQGSPLFEQFQNECGGTITLRIGKLAEVSASLIALGAKGEERKRIDAIPASLHWGARGYCLSAALRNSPLSLEIHGRAGHNEKLATGSIAFDPAAWIGQPVLHLSFYEQIRQFIQALGGGTFRIECSRDGNPLFKLESKESVQVQRQWMAFIEAIEKCRYVARYAKQNPLLPELSAQDVRDVEFLYELITTGEAKRMKSKLRIAGRIVLHPAFREVDVYTVDSKSSALSLKATYPEAFPFLRNSVEIGPLETIATQVCLANRAKVIRALKKGEKKVEFVWKGTKSCELIWKFHHDADSPSKKSESQGESSTLEQIV